MNLSPIAPYYLFAEPVPSPHPPYGRARTKALARMLGLSSRHRVNGERYERFGPVMTGEIGG